MKSRKKTSPQNVLEAGSVPPPAPNPKSAFASLPKGWAPASQALDRVRAVPTIFPGFNQATRCGGVPLRRIVTVHGPTHGGKSAFLGGLIRSFLEAKHVASYCDAEHATDLTFFDELMGAPVASFPNFMAMRPDSYEDTITAVDEFLKWMVAERKARFGKYTKTPIPPEEDLAAIQVIDSINKLVPKRELDQLKAKGGENIDKGWGRLRAAFNQAFLDHVVPLLGKAETTLAIVVQERDDDDLDPWEMPKLKGGKASQYDASLLIRVMKAKEVSVGEGKDKVVHGYRHRIRIWKSKVGHMDGRWSDSAFHMSNGSLIPGGFDLARDAIEIGKELGIVQVSGSWLTYGKQRWQGEPKAVVSLTKNPAALASLMHAVNVAIRKEIGS